jgi:hypothetical protein
LLLPQFRKKSDHAEAAPGLETPDEVRQAEERDRALISRARRRREEVAVERARFELTQDKIVFGFELGLAAVVVTVTLVLSVLNPDLLPAVLLSGGGVGCLASWSKRRSARRDD